MVGVDLKTWDEDESISCKVYLAYDPTMGDEMGNALEVVLIQTKKGIMPFTYFGSLPTEADKADIMEYEDFLCAFADPEEIDDYTDIKFIRKF